MDKLDEIECLASGNSEHVNRLIELSIDKDEEIRFRAFEAFESFYPNKKIIDHIKTGLKDEDELVRTTCVELLGDWKVSSATEDLYLALSDESDIVRSATITSISKIARKDSIWLLKEKFSTSQGLEKTSSAAALYKLDEHCYLKNLLELLEDNDYRVRSATANLLAEFTKEADKHYVGTQLKKALLKEETKAAASSFKNAIQEFQSR